MSAEPTRARRCGTGAGRLTRRLPIALPVAAALALAPLSGASGQASEGSPADTLTFRIDPLVVTATRGPREVSKVPVPVSVVQRQDLERQVPNTVSDAFRALPGLDVTGVGANRVLPQIRGQTGQRILLLEDGLRMNNTRRENDFGEPPAFIDVGAVDQVEVIRGPASVLYGSDAIGGVVNIITRVPRTEGFRGRVSYLHGATEEQHRVSARVSGRSGPMTLETGGSWREAGSYEAPAGTFGEITLDAPVRVRDTGVEDRSFDARLGWDLTPRVTTFAKLEAYEADDAGFGSVAPDAYAPGDPEIVIRYPNQRFTKVTAGVEARDLGLAIADRVALTTYGQDNERDLWFDFLVRFAFPGGGGSSALATRNFTDVRTYGFRAEARKLVRPWMLLTYGADGFRDRAKGTDLSTTRDSVSFGGPPSVTTATSNRPSIPDGAFRSAGLFAQGEFEVGERVSLIAGGRFQSVSAETFVTPGLGNIPLETSKSSGVMALNAMLSLTRELDLVASVGSGFRSPNLVDLFFDGPVTESSAYQVPSPDLEAETNVNVDVGARYHDGRVFLEGFYFRNTVSNGIQGRPVLDANGDTLTQAGLDVYRRENVDEILYQGWEFAGEVRLDSGVGLGASWSVLDAEDTLDPLNPVGQSYASKVSSWVGYDARDGDAWIRAEVRRSGVQDEVDLGAGNPVGSVVPSFTVLNLRAGARLFEVGGTTHRVTAALSNVTDALYAEASNTSFFRPEPGRNLTLSWAVDF